MTRGRGLFVAEATRQVGSGHLMECLTIADALGRGQAPAFSAALLEPWAVEMLRERGLPVLDRVQEEQAAPFDWILINAWSASTDLQRRCRRRTDRLAVLDELGGLDLDCDLLVNFTVRGQRGEYRWQGSKPDMHLGPDYYPLRESIRLAGREKRARRGALVSLGGVDRSRSTLRVAGVLGRRPDLECTYVLGPGSSVAPDEVRVLLHNAPGQRVLQAPPDFDQRLVGVRLLVSAGGNTLYEADHLGVPALVVWEDEHERQNAEAFAGRGGAVEIVGTPGTLDSQRLLQRASAPPAPPPRRLVDGLGARRIAALLERPLEHSPAGVGRDPATGDPY